MRRRCGLVMLTIVGVGLLIAYSIQAKRSPNGTPQENDALTVYIIGQVVKPSKLQPRKPLTLTQAINEAGALTHDAKLKKVRIWRLTDGRAGPIEIAIDLDAVRKHHVADPILLPYDVVEVQ